MESKIIALAGNPNVGKSTVFNKLTGLNQHTGNWPGKTVKNARGKFTYKGQSFVLVDIPGTYSLFPTSVEEEIARDFICSGEPDVTVVVADSTCLERNLNLVLQILHVTNRVVVCVNLLDEAKKKHIHVDLEALSHSLGVPVIGAEARNNKGLDKLKKEVYVTTLQSPKTAGNHTEINEDMATDFIFQAKEIYQKCVKTASANHHEFDRKIDRIVTSPSFGIPIMLAMMALIFWITIFGANYPSTFLAHVFSLLEMKLLALSALLNAPVWLEGALILGVYKTLTWVVAVMLPPMAIFFPLFTLLEDFGYLPRVAFNMDKLFKKASAHGKQSLTMCMGFGCNACGIIGCRIIDSPRERLIAILTNNFVPCNGRFPTLIAIITMFFISFNAGVFKTGLAALMLTALILLGILVTLMVSKLLSKTILKGMPSSFTLELPPYRRPQFGSVIIRSILDRTLFVLGRAMVVAAPAGLIIWGMANIHVDGNSLLSVCTDFLDPFASLIGVDGVIIMAFILGFPANEIVLPIIIMCYMATGNMTDFSSLEQLKILLIDNDWTWLTAACTMLLCLFHFPCATTCLTIKKETCSLKWTCLAFAIPTATGILFCFTLTTLSKAVALLF